VKRSGCAFPAKYKPVSKTPVFGTPPSGSVIVAYSVIYESPCMRVFGTQLQGQSPLRTPVCASVLYRTGGNQKVTTHKLPLGSGPSRCVTLQPAESHPQQPRAAVAFNQNASRRNWRCGSLRYRGGMRLPQPCRAGTHKPRQRWACVVQIQRHASAGAASNVWFRVAVRHSPSLPAN
jgi:hypothetical protein